MLICLVYYIICRYWRIVITYHITLHHLISIHRSLACRIVYYSHKLSVYCWANLKFRLYNSKHEIFNLPHNNSRSSSTVLHQGRACTAHFIKLQGKFQMRTIGNLNSSHWSIAWLVHHVHGPLVRPLQNCKALILVVLPLHLRRPAHRTRWRGFIIV